MAEMVARLMINFRFHIVSLTAVLLALGMGLVLGTAFLDDALISTLRSQLNGLEDDLARERERVRELRDEVAVVVDEHDLMDEELASHVVGGSLDGQPVLVIASEGVGADLTDRVLGVFGEADADIVGVWELGADFNLDDDDAVARLAIALDVTTEDADRLRDNVLGQLSDVLYGATDASESAGNDAQTLSGELSQRPDESVESDAEGTEAEPHEPDLLARLVEAGFVDYAFLEASDAEVVELPPGNLRVVVVDGPESEVRSSVMTSLLGGLASNGRVPVVVAAPGPLELDTDDEDNSGVAPLIMAVRSDEELVERVSTVDNLDRVVGKIATVLAAAAARPGDPQIGSYGQGDGTELLIPPPAEPEEESGE